MSTLEQARKQIKEGNPRGEAVATAANVSFRTVERFLAGDQLSPKMEKAILGAIVRLSKPTTQS